MISQFAFGLIRAFWYNFGKCLRGKCVRNNGNGVFDVIDDIGPNGKRKAIGIAFSHVGDVAHVGSDVSIEFSSGQM